MLPHIRDAARRAAEIYKDTGAKARVEQDGYTRVDPFLVAGGERVPVLLRPLDKLLGAFIRNDVSGILVNSERSAGLIHMTCAHELGHYFMGHDTTADDSIDYGPQADRVEQEADWFAYQLLASRALLANVMRRKNWSLQSIKNPLVLYQLSLRLGISYTATAWSLARQKLMAASEVKALLTVQPAEIKRAIVGDHPFDARKDVWLLDERDRDSVLEPRSDDPVIVRLKSHATSGYLWSLSELVSEGFQIQPLESHTDQAADPSSLLFGGPTTAEFLVTQGEGARELEGHPVLLAMKEARPWMKGTQANATFETMAQFENIEPGLTRVAKQELLRETSAA